MNDDEQRVSPIEAVRLSFAALCEFERHANRTDLLLVLATILALTVMSFLTAGAWYQGLVLGLAYTLGTFAGGVIYMHKARRFAFRQLKDQYHEIELQNMIREEEEGSS